MLEEAVTLTITRHEGGVETSFQKKAIIQIWAGSRLIGGDIASRIDYARARGDSLPLHMITETPTNELDFVGYPGGKRLYDPFSGALRSIPSGEYVVARTECWELEEQCLYASVLFPRSLLTI